jgi:hypothetical protein
MIPLPSHNVINYVTVTKFIYLMYRSELFVQNLGHAHKAKTFASTAAISVNTRMFEPAEYGSHAGEKLMHLWRSRV